MKDTKIPELINTVNEKSSQIKNLANKLASAKTDIAKAAKKANILIELIEDLEDEVLDLRDELIKKDAEIAVLRQNYYDAVQETLETEEELEKAMNGQFILEKRLLEQTALTQNERAKNAATEASLDLTTKFLLLKMKEVEELKKQKKVADKIADARIKHLEGRLSKASDRINALLQSLGMQSCIPKQGFRGWVYKWMWKAMLATMGVKGVVAKGSGGGGAASEVKKDDNKVKEAVATAANSNAGSKSQLEMIVGVVGVIEVVPAGGAAQAPGQQQKAAAAPAKGH